MRFGISQKEWDFLVQNVFDKIKASGARIFIFGSRARESHHKFSDIDLLVVSSDDLSSLIGKVSEEIEESNFPYKVDIVEDKDLAASYRASIDRDKIEL